MSPLRPDEDTLRLGPFGAGCGCFGALGPVQGKGPLKLQKGRLISLRGQIRASETLHCMKYTV